MLASIPNVRFYDVIRALGEGRWEYQDAGFLTGRISGFYGSGDAEATHRRGYEVVTLLPLSQAVRIQGT